MKFKIHNQAFTLLEILLTIAIIAVLAGIVIVAINPGRQLAQARNAERSSDLRSLYSAVQQYYIDNKAWPTSTMPSTLTEICDENGNPTGCLNLNNLVPTYLSAIPRDPSLGNTAEGTNYKLAINPNTNMPELIAPSSTEYDLDPAEIGTTTLSVPQAESTLITYGKPWRNQYFTNLTQQGNISTWSGSTFPIVSGLSAAVVTKDRVYVSGNSPASTYTAPINTDGTIGSWSSSGSVGVGVIDIIKTGDRIHAIPESGSIIYTTTINGDGTLNSWVNSNNNLPFAANHRMEAFTTENYAYLIRANNSAEVYYAPINQDGTLGAWANSNNNLNQTPGLNMGITVSLTKNKIYFFGLTAAWSNVYLFADIDSNGLVGSWQTVPSNGEPSFGNHSKTFTTNNTIYYFGGQGSQAMYYATLNNDGEITGWQTGTSIGATLAGSSVFATNSKLYIVGGFDQNGSSQSSIRIGNITGGKNDYTAE